VPGFKIEGKTIAGFAAFKNHLSYLPPRIGRLSPRSGRDTPNRRFPSYALIRSCPR
jgi:hypothetical protein